MTDILHTKTDEAHVGDPAKLLEAALFYASLGLEVFPCNPNGDYAVESDKKAPLGWLAPNGVSNATTDPAIIQEWWKQCPTANIGIKAGATLLIIDVDCKKGADGYADLATMEAVLGTLPATPYAITPSGGKHYFFHAPVLPEGVRIKGRAKIVFQGKKTSIDLRVGNEYVLAAPSMVDNKEYSFPENAGLALNADGSLNVATLPAAWVAALPLRDSSKSVAPKKSILSSAYNGSPDAVERCRRYVAKMDASVQENNGSGDCFHAACIIFWDFGLEESDGRPILDEFNARCAPPWSDAELRHKIKDALDQSGKTTQRGYKLNDSESSYSPAAKNDPKNERRKSRLIATPMSEHVARAPRWLWKGRIALGELTLVSGSPGSGKTTLITNIAATVSSGGNFADGMPCASPGKVLYLSSESSADIFWASLKASGADLSRILIAAKLESDVGKSDSLLRFKNASEIDTFLSDNPDVVVVIFDPAGSFLGGKTDTNRDNEVRDELNPVGDLAEKHGVAVIIVSHPSKSGRNCTHADESVLGSTGFVGLARCVWHVVKHPAKNDEGFFVRYLCAGKMNNTSPPGVLRFRIEGVPVAPPLDPVYSPRGMVYSPRGEDLTGLFVVPLPAEEGDQDRDASDIFREVRKVDKALEGGRPGPAPKAREEAESWLKEALSQPGVPFVAAMNLKDRWKAEGGSEHTLNRAKASLGVVSSRVTTGGKTFSVWHLPSITVAKDGTVTHVGTSILATDPAPEPPPENDTF